MLHLVLVGPPVVEGQLLWTLLHRSKEIVRRTHNNVIAVPKG
jgi:hypothetical protein